MLVVANGNGLKKARRSERVGEEVGREGGWKGRKRVGEGSKLKIFPFIFLMLLVCSRSLKCPGRLTILTAPRSVLRRLEVPRGLTMLKASRPVLQNNNQLGLSGPAT